jgi:hypothetical protein
VTVGSVLTGAPEAGGATVSLRVTGLYRLEDPASTYWALDLLPTSGVSVHGSTVGYAGNSLATRTIIYGPAVVSPAAFSGGLAARQCSWSVLPQAPGLARGNIGALAAATSAAVSQLAVAPPQGLDVSSGLPRLLSGMASTIVLARSLFTVAALQLLLVAGAELVLAARLLAGLAGVLIGTRLRSRRTQSAVFAALGVGKNAQAGQLCLERCALSVPAAAAGLLAGTGLAQLMVPAITLTADAAAPVPPALVVLPLGPAAALALVTAAVPVAVAAVSILRRPDPAAQLRAEAG